jgi:hypothetical protein
MMGVLMAGITTVSFSSLPEGDKLILQIDSFLEQHISREWQPS